MVRILNKEEIIALLPQIDVVEAMHTAFVAYSNKLAVVPPVGELLFEEPKGEMHLKYGYIKNDAFAVVKVAAGFYGNTALGIPSSQGCMLLFSQKTGETKAVLLDGGHLTDIRTAAAGALVAQYFAPKQINAVGIIGAGIQAALQLRLLQQTRPCTNVWVYNRNPERALALQKELAPHFKVQLAPDTATLANACNLIITTTPSETPLLWAKDIKPGTHITAVGADTPVKQELDAAIFTLADRVVVDSIPQSAVRGEVYQARKAGVAVKDKLVELGAALQDPSKQRQQQAQITVADLTGVAVQDMMIAKAVYQCSVNN